MIDVNRSINKDSMSKAATVMNVLDKAYEICAAANFFDESALKSFMLTLTSLQSALSTLDESIEEYQATGDSIHDAIKESALEVEELNTMVNSLVASFGK